MNMLQLLQQRFAFDRWASAFARTGYNPDEILCALMALDCVSLSAFLLSTGGLPAAAAAPDEAPSE